MSVTTPVSARLSLKPAVDQKAGNDAVGDLQQRREQLRLSGEQNIERNRQREHFELLQPNQPAVIGCRSP